MRVTGLVGRTLRTAPSGVAPWVAAAARAGFVRPTPLGLAFLPLGVEVMRRLDEAILAGIEWGAVQVRAEHGREWEVLGAVLQGEVQSYRHLPLRIATHTCADHPTEVSSQTGAGGDLLLVGAFAHDGQAEAFKNHVASSMSELAGSCHLRLVEAGTPPEWFIAAGVGDVELLACHECGLLDRRAMAASPQTKLSDGGSEELRLVHTPGASTIQALADVLGVRRERTLKALFLTDPGGALVLIVIRGDLDVSLDKLGRVVNRGGFRPATEAEILACGAVPGFASPIGLRIRSGESSDGVVVAVDDSVNTGSSFVAGANRIDYHYAGVDPRRDFSATYTGDLALAPAGATCPRCSSPRQLDRGCGVASWHSLPGPVYTDESGVEMCGTTGWMAVDRLAWFEAIVNGCADEVGIRWPLIVSPADVLVVDLKAAADSRQAADVLQAGGLRVLYDDRPLSAGAKFTDADLIGCPLRVTVSPRSLMAGGAELAFRRGLDPEVVDLASLPEAVRGRLVRLMSS